MKNCRTCHADKELSDFRVVKRRARAHWAKGPKAGLILYCVPTRFITEIQTQCRNCEREQARTKKLAKYRANPRPFVDAVLRYARRHPERVAKRKLEARRRNPHAHRAEEGKRRKLKRAQRCTCCTRKQIGDFYASRPAGQHVDHIIPLSRGGAHCVKNMQYLPAVENIRKHNRLPMELCA